MLAKRLLFPAWLCLLAGTHAARVQEPPARWTLVHSEPGRHYYLDERSVSTQGGVLTYWVLVNFDYGPQFDGARPYKSARLLKHARCATRAQDTKAFFQYDAPMAQGELRWASTVEDDVLHLEPLKAGGIEARILEMACAVGR